MISQVELIALLLNGSGIVGGDSSQTAINQLMQLAQTGYCDLRLTKLHAPAYHGIQHPSRNYRDCARAVVYLDDTPTAALFAISIANLSPIKRVPTIVNLYFLTDMGRMSGESQLAEKTGSTSEVNRLGRVWPRSYP